mmetsp:Transcript_8841/g.12885  ORF Transcript_8841/g.12885 Transcript_8841/m.12885 type:complete len:80 (-) Transcript_8841:213-452(-)
MFLNISNVYCEVLFLLYLKSYYLNIYSACENDETENCWETNNSDLTEKKLRVAFARTGMLIGENPKRKVTLYEILLYSQ